MLFTHYMFEFVPAVALKNNDIRLQGRGLMINVTLLVVSIGVQGFIFSVIEHWTYLDGLYFSTVCVLTVGFGDFTPTTTAGKIVLFPCVLVGIAQLALVVSEIIDFFSQRSLDLVQATKLHVERERRRKEMTHDYIDLNQEIQLFEAQQKAEDNKEEMISLCYSLISFFTLWLIGALIFSKMEGWTYGDGLYFNYIFFLTIGFGDYEPTSNASRPVFIVYALMTVPIITSFAVQSVTKVMSLLSERRLSRHKINIEKPPPPVSHSDLINESTGDLIKEIAREGMQDMLIETVLRMDLATRKLLSATLQGHSKLVLKADTLVQLRSTNLNTDDFVEQFHDVKVVQELAYYRELFARFLVTASAVRNLSGEEKRVFERRQRKAQVEAEKLIRTSSDSSSAQEMRDKTLEDVDTEAGIGEVTQEKLEQLGFTRSQRNTADGFGGEEMKHHNTERNSLGGDDQEEEAEEREECRKDRIGSDVEQAEGLNNPHHNRNNADTEGGG